jgi:hypothetical protein
MEGSGAPKRRKLPAGDCSIIINKLITNDRKCHKLLSKDGITARYLVIDRLPGIFEGIAIDIDFQRSKMKSISRMVTITKNLDEYQFIICSEIRNMSDSNPYKKQLQKYRVLTIASFATLVYVLSSLENDQALQEWNYFAQILLTRISETRLEAYSNQKQRNNITRKPISPVFDFLGIHEDDIDCILGSIY